MAAMPNYRSLENGPMIQPANYIESSLTACAEGGGNLSPFQGCTCSQSFSAHLQPF